MSGACYPAFVYHDDAYSRREQGLRALQSTMASLTAVAIATLAGCSEPRPPAPPEPECVEGRVIEPGGKPVRGALVHLSTPGDPCIGGVSVELMAADDGTWRYCGVSRAECDAIFLKVLSTEHTQSRRTVATDKPIVTELIPTVVVWGHVTRPNGELLDLGSIVLDSLDYFDPPSVDPVAQAFRHGSELRKKPMMFVGPIQRGQFRISVPVGRFEAQVCGHHDSSSKVILEVERDRKVVSLEVPEALTDCSVGVCHGCGGGLEVGPLLVKEDP